MAKNILIFSDGTGQAGGVFLDENRSNIYKLYRATRVGPDSAVDPAEQVAFYDAGLGSKPPDGGTAERLWRMLYNLVSQATGFGLTANIVDCYEMLVRLWQPGDRIFLFGFSRGAYTVRCLGGVLVHCGIPTALEHGTPLKRDGATARRLAGIAVRRVYQHTSSRRHGEATARQRELLDQRDELARRFRARHGVDGNDPSRLPYFIGVFDTVGAIGNRQALLLVGAGTVALALAGAWLMPGWVPLPWTLSYWCWFAIIAGGGAAVALAAYLRTHVKWEIGLPHCRWWRPFHLTELKQRFHDRDLDASVAYGRHAIAIDETRRVFAPVPWGNAPAPAPADGSEARFEQVWFAGNHADVGGGYAENEARLSDIALDWMARIATGIPHGIRIDPALLSRHPDAGGMQHDEVKRGFPVVTKWLGWTWRERHRTLPAADAAVHPTVHERFALRAVLQWDLTAPWRPATLKDHADFRDRWG